MISWKRPISLLIVLIGMTIASRPVTCEAISHTQFIHCFRRHLPAKVPLKFDPALMVGRRVIGKLWGREGGVTIWKLVDGRKVCTKNLTKMSGEKSLSVIEENVAKWKARRLPIPDYLGAIEEDGQTHLVYEYISGLRLGLDPINPMELTRDEAKALVDEALLFSNIHPDPSPGNLVYDPVHHQVRFLDFFDPPRETPGGISVPVSEALESIWRYHHLEVPESVETRWR